MGGSIIVAGLGRCGSSLMMQMLEAGGYPVEGEFPAYESEGNRALWDADNPELYAGRAIKLVDPFRYKTSHVGANVIYCTRDLGEQAKSQIKFATLMMGLPNRPSPTDLRKMRKILERDDRRARSWLAPRAGVWLEVRFEDTINVPYVVAQRIADFLGHQPDVAAMSGAVRLRTDKCHPSLFEATLLGLAA